MKEIKLEHITKIEGHANLNLAIDKGVLIKCELRAIEGSRYFEGLLKGRNCIEAPELTQRICGICSSAHSVCSVQAVENALKIKPTLQTKMLRELQTMGERIRSHAAHLYFLALPDYFGFESVLDMVDKHGKEVKRALRLIKLGNNIVSLVAGRDLHAISTQPGGFLKLPSQLAINNIRDTLKEHQSDALLAAKLISRLKIPSFFSESEHVSLQKPKEYAMVDGDIFSDTHKFSARNYGKYLEEYHEKYATSNFVVKKGKTYVVGALSRIINNKNFLSINAKKFIKTLPKKLNFPCANPFLNNLAQAVELISYVDRAIVLCNQLKISEEKPNKLKMKAGRGISIIEAPRGLLIHDYTLDKAGNIEKANILTPTCQNLRSMEDDLKAYIPLLLRQKLNKSQLVIEIEKLIRAYDPCFSCSTHFLKVNWL